MSKYRNVISVITGISFFFVGLSGLLMKFAFKSQWLNEIHIWTGIVMVVVAALHLILNWKPFAGYFQRRWLYALAVPFLAYAVMMVAQSSGASAGGGGAHGGMGGVIQKLGQAKAADVAPVFGKTPDALVNQLRTAGFQVDSADQTLFQISRANHRPPQAILSVVSQ